MGTVGAVFVAAGMAVALMAPRLLLVAPVLMLVGVACLVANGVWGF